MRLLHPQRPHYIFLIICPTHFTPHLLPFAWPLQLIDVHGDEEIPYSFLVDNRGTPSWSSQGGRLAALHTAFSAAFEAASPDFQSLHGYPGDAPNSANLNLCRSVGRWGAGLFGWCAMLGCAVPMLSHDVDTTASPSNFAASTWASASSAWP